MVTVFRSPQTIGVASLLFVALALPAAVGCGGHARDRPTPSPVLAMFNSVSNRTTGSHTEDLPVVAVSRAEDRPAKDRPTVKLAQPPRRSVSDVADATHKMAVPANSEVVSLASVNVDSPPSKRAELDRPDVMQKRATPASARVAALRKPTSPEQVIPEAIWWNQQAAAPLREPGRAIPISLEQLAYEALFHSDHIKALRTIPPAVAKEIYIAESEFDPKAFVDSKFRDTSDPVSDTLTTGGPARLNEHRWSFEGGLRQRLPSGTTASISQQFGHTNSNSLFFIPNNQGSARLALNLSHPLLRGAGTEYNRSLVLLAHLDLHIANDDFRRALQDHLLSAFEAYWALYAQRAGLVQRQQSAARVEKLADDLEARMVMDATATQIIRVRAALARRQADLVRNRADIRNTESVLYRLTNAPTMADGAEVIPQASPLPVPTHQDARIALEQALRYRPEVDAAFREVRAAKVRLNVSQQDLLPFLNLVVETYVSGIEGQSDVGAAWADQFGEGAPSYTAGLAFDMPLGNRGPKARYAQSRLALAEATYALRSTLATVASEVDIAVREVEALFAETMAKSHSVIAARTEVDHLEARWELLGGDEGITSLALEDLLQAYERLLSEELSLAHSLAAHNVAVLKLRHATGTLIEIDQPFRPGGWQAAPVSPEEIPVPARPTSLIADRSERPAMRAERTADFGNFSKRPGAKSTLRR